MEQQTVSKMERVQTAVEWFYENTQDYVRLSDIVPMVIKIEAPFEKYMDILKQAKQMEKEQIIKAHSDGFDHIVVDFKKQEFAEQYYNETYNK